MSDIEGFGWAAAYLMMAALWGTVWAHQLDCTDDDFIIPVGAAAICWPLVVPAWAGIMLGSRIMRKETGASEGGGKE